MRRIVLPSMIAALMVAGSTAAVAQHARLASRTRMYDPKTVVTVSGTVAKVEHTGHSGGGIHGAGGVHLLLKTDKGNVDVRLGPSWFIDEQPVKIAAHDAVEVRGSRITYAGKPAIVAAEVKKGDQVLKLRQDSGVPIWHVQSRRRG